MITSRLAFSTAKILCGEDSLRRGSFYGEDLSTATIFLRRGSFYSEDSSDSTAKIPQTLRRRFPRLYGEDSPDSTARFVSWDSHLRQNVYKRTVSPPYSSFRKPSHHYSSPTVKMKSLKVVCLILFWATQVMGVSLINFNRQHCRGPRRVCRNIPPNVCCFSQAGARIFRSSKCAGCRRADTHLVFHDRNCQNGAGGVRGSHCLNGHDLLSTKWRRGQGKRSTHDAFADFADVPCNGTVLPDIISKDGETYFKINHEVPDDHTQELEAWADDDSLSYDDLPEHLLQYQTEDH